ncbi:hypothetical protein FGO68_gene5978 [Halteria grandinella]|uniref:Uncharacterized protein n=1 Tax=Halteria grandinella TaxID=5974 RepID=A0A8J8NNP2_HALGN|nr:hypothetical protein FGO68_gene5978 [Halteria grandinella]
MKILKYYQMSDNSEKLDQPQSMATYTSALVNINKPIPAETEEKEQIKICLEELRFTWENFQMLKQLSMEALHRLRSLEGDDGFLLEFNRRQAEQTKAQHNNAQMTDSLCIQKTQKPESDYIINKCHDTKEEEKELPPIQIQSISSLEGESLSYQSDGHSSSQFPSQYSASGQDLTPMRIMPPLDSCINFLNGAIDSRISSKRTQKKLVSDSFQLPKLTRNVVVVNVLSKFKEPKQRRLLLQNWMYILSGV